MRLIIILAAACTLLVSVMANATADTFGTGDNQFTIEFVTISGHTNPTSGYGVVNQDYRIGTYEITNDQWDKFKANIAPMQVTGVPSNAYDQDTYWTGTNVPTNRISWYEAAQFVNWLNTSNGHQAAYNFVGTQGTVDYSLRVWDAADAASGKSWLNLYRHKDAFYFLPTEDEWVKAAYWNGTHMQTYATKDGSIPVAGSDSNYNQLLGGSPWNVGSGSEELNGTFDMMGNVKEWMESPYGNTSYSYGSSSNRVLRGGSYNATVIDALGYSSRSRNFPYQEGEYYGFRVASVPEPTSLLLLFFGGLALQYKKL